MSSDASGSLLSTDSRKPVAILHIYRPQCSCSKVMFSQASVILFIGGGGGMHDGVWQDGMHGNRMCVAGGLCMAGWHAWQGACMMGSCVVGHVWQGMCGGGHAWFGHA